MGPDEYFIQTCSIVIIKALYDYVEDTLEVNATSPYDDLASLELVNYGAMTWDGSSGYRYRVEEGANNPPANISVRGPEDSCTTVVEYKLA